MSDVAAAAPNAGAQPVVQSVEASQAAAEQSILAAIQANAAAAPLTEKPANEPTEPFSGDDLANNPFADTGESSQTEPEPLPDQAAADAAQQQAQPEDQKQSQEQTQTSESARQLINKSNIDPAAKKELSDSVYRANRFKELGFTVEHAEALKDLGITPEVVIERTSIHPTLEDARRDAGLAATMRQISEDLTTNPSAFLEKIGQVNPTIAQNIRSAILSGISSPEDLGEQVWFPFVQESTWNLLDNLNRAAAAEQNADLKEAVAIVRQKVFGQNPQPPSTQRRQAPAADDANNPLRKELEQLRAEKARQESSQRESWTTSLQNEGLKTVGNLAAQYLSTQGVGSLPGTFSQDATRELALSVVNAIQSDPRLAADAQVFMSGPMTRERYQQGIEWLKARAIPLINIHGQRVREKYRPLSSTTPNPNPQPNAPRQASRPDVARPSGGAPRPTPGPNPTQQVFAAQKKGLSIEQMIAANSAAMAARRR